MIDLSIIIVNYNTKKLVIDCIDSIRKSKPEVSYEIIVIDNGSSDNSVVEIKNQKSKIKKFIFLVNDENLGFAKANNQGIKASGGKYKLLLNSDTIVKQRTLDNLVGIADKTKDAGAIGAKLVNEDGSEQGSVFRFPGVIRAIKQYWFGRSDLMDKYVPESSNLQRVEALSMACFLITPKAIDKVGLLDERYFMYFEDLDYCRRINGAGLKVYYYPKSMVVHHHGESGKLLANTENQWRRLVPSSKIYHGTLKHYLINFVLWSGQKLQKVLGGFSN